MKPPRMKGIDCGAANIDLRTHENIVWARPHEIHHKSDGAITDDGPSFCFVLLSHNDQLATVGEVSMKMFNEALADIGYKIEKV